ncbi:MAG: hypothetical protein N2314_06770 [Brevinematales bacterium]|nr:hypothetical protein [Brevinematales bacterium]
MNFSEIELFEIARLIKEEEKQFLEKAKKYLSHTEELSKILEDIRLFYAREEKQKKRSQKICQYVDNEDTLAYLRDIFADILTFQNQPVSSLTPHDILHSWITNHEKILTFFNNLLLSTQDDLIQKDIQSILEKEKMWHTTLEQQKP